MNKKQNQVLASRLIETIKLMEFGIALMRQNIARRNKNATEEFIDSELQRWLIEQPRYFFTSN